MSASSLIHIQSIVHQLVEAAADTTARAAMGKATEDLCACGFEYHEGFAH